MASIRKFINRIIRSDAPPLLGRWKIDYCENRIAKKVNLTNEDHCGTCADYILTKYNSIPLQKYNSINNSKRLDSTSSLFFYRSFSS